MAKNEVPPQKNQQQQPQHQQQSLFPSPISCFFSLLWNTSHI